MALPASQKYLGMGAAARKGGALPLGPAVEAPPKSREESAARRGQRRRGGRPQEERESAVEAPGVARARPDPSGRTKRSRIASTPHLHAHTERELEWVAFNSATCEESARTTYILKPNHRGTCCRRAESFGRPTRWLYVGGRRDRRPRPTRRAVPLVGAPEHRCAALSPTRPPSRVHYFVTANPNMPYYLNICKRNIFRGPIPGSGGR